MVERTPKRDRSSIIGVIATEDLPSPTSSRAPGSHGAPARRWALTGGYAYHSSGDIFLAFSTANRDALTAGVGASPRQQCSCPTPRLEPGREFPSVRRRSSTRWSPMPITSRDGNIVRGRSSATGSRRSSPDLAAPSICNKVCGATKAAGECVSFFPCTHAADRWRTTRFNASTLVLSALLRKNSQRKLVDLAAQGGLSLSWCVATAAQPQV